MRRIGRLPRAIQKPVTLGVVAGILVVCLPLVLATCRLDDLVNSQHEAVIQMTLSGAIIGVADSVRLSSVVRVDGEQRDGVPLAWSTSEPAIATVDSTGLVRGRARGKAMITVRLIGGAISSVEVQAADTVWVTAASLELAPADTMLTSAGDTLCLRHIARDAQGAPISGTTPVFSLMNDPDSTVSLNGTNGCAVGLTSGRTATVRATLDTATASADITVQQTVTALAVESANYELFGLGTTVSLSAVAQDRRGIKVPDPQIAWTSADATIAVVDSAGEVTARGKGITFIRAAVDNVVDSARITVSPPVLSITPPTVDATAAEGSAAPRTAVIRIENDGTGSPTWTAGTSSAWLGLSKTSGSFPDSTQVTFDPAGLSAGTHLDTVVVAAPAAAGSPAKVPATFTITPCAESPIAPDAIINAALTTAHCGAPHWAGSFARIFSFTGNSGDTISLHMTGDFDAYLFLVDGNGTLLASNDECPSNAAPGPACVEEFELTTDGTFRIEATTSDAGATGNFTLYAVEPTAPDPSQSLDQLRSDGSTAIGVGATTDETTVAFEATVMDPDPADTLQLQVEVKEVGTAFDGNATATSPSVSSGSTPQVMLVSLTENTSYHWQAWTIDQTGRASAPVAFGANGETEADFSINAMPEIPEDPTGLGQFKADGTTTIAVGGTTDQPTVVFEATVTDPDPGDALQLEVEVQLVGTAFTNSLSASATCVASGSTCQVAVTGLTADTNYHWQVRTRDQTDRTSDWVAFGNNFDPDDVHFRVEIP